MRVILALVVLGIFGFSSVSFADQLCFTWSVYEDESATGFRLHKDTRGVTVADDIPTTATEFCITDPKDEKCVNYFMVAFTPTATSVNSDVAVVCPTSDDPPPAEQPPVSIGGFSVRVVIEPNQ